MSRDIERYQRDYLGDYGFESVLVDYRRRLVLERLLARRPQVVLEVGCGSEPLYPHYLRAAGPVANWTVVEPGPQFAANARATDLPNGVVIEGFLEASLPAVRAALPRAPDVVLCSGLLNEVPDASALLAAMRAVMGPDSIVHVNVANAASLHRRLALAMGLIPQLTTLSERNRTLQQPRVYDAGTLATDLEAAGFAVVAQGGYFVKPFTHAQMENVAPVLGDAVLDGLFELGKAEPAWACEIYVEARPA